MPLEKPGPPYVLLPLLVTPLRIWPLRIVISLKPLASEMAALTAAQDSPETQRRLESEGATVVRMSPQEFGAFMVSEMSKWEKVVRESGIKAD